MWCEVCLLYCFSSILQRIKQIRDWSCISNLKRSIWALVDIWANLLNLNPLIPDKPVCSAGQKKIYGVARGEMVAVNCSVDANPGELASYIDIVFIYYIIIFFSLEIFFKFTIIKSLKKIFFLKGIYPNPNKWWCLRMNSNNK